MKKTAKYIIMAVALSATMPLQAALHAGDDDVRVSGTDVVVPADTIEGEMARDMRENSELHKRVIVGNDTVSVIVPEKNYGRYHRGLYTHLFVPKGQFACGLQASYGKVSAEDLQVLSYVTDLDFKVSTYSFNPYVSYFYKHNRSLGLRFGISHSDFNIDSFGLDFDGDINFNIKDLKYRNSKLSLEIFHRNYIGLDASRRFAVFNEVALKYSNGNGSFQRLYNDTPKVTDSHSNEVRLDFSPGLCVFIQEHVAFNVSFGIFGWYWRKDKSVTDGVDEGTRSSSGCNFKINLLNLKLGVAVYI